MNSTSATAVTFSDGGSLMQTGTTLDQTNFTETLNTALNASGLTQGAEASQTGGSWLSGDSSAAQDAMTMNISSFKDNFDAPLLPKRDFDLQPPMPIVIADIGAEENRPRDHNYHEFVFKEGGAEYVEGQWDNDLLCGHAEHVQADGRTYIGTFKDGLRHGRGKIVLPGKGGQFECEFREGTMVGKVSRISYTMFDGKTGS